MADDYGTNVWEPDLPEVWEGVHGRRLIREEGRPLSGADGAHTVMNLSDAPMRYVMVAAHSSPDIIEYPDKGEFAAGAKSLSQRGKPFFVRLPIPSE